MIFLDFREERLRCSVAFLVEDEPGNEYLSSTHNSLSLQWFSLTIMHCFRRDRRKAFAKVGQPPGQETAALPSPLEQCGH